jgi:hypothetical protein
MIAPEAQCLVRRDRLRNSRRQLGLRPFGCLRVLHLPDVAVRGGGH